MNSPIVEVGMRKPFALVALLSGMACGEFMETGRWIFPGGNLVSNWSFENMTTEICQEDQPGWGGTQTYCRDRRNDARSGNYILSVLSKNEGDTSTQPYAISQISRLLPAEPSTAYTFSVQARIYWTERIASSAPVVCWMRADKSFIGCDQGQPYLEAFPSGASNWSPYSFTFTTSPEAQFLYFHLVQSTNDGVQGGDGDLFEFDNLQIRKSGQPSGVVETRTYSDAAGRADHTIVNDGSKDLITQFEYDTQGRLHREYLPFRSATPFSSGEFVVSALSLGSDMTVDYQSLTKAYADIAGRVGAMAAADLPGSLTFYAIVAAAEDEAPVGQGPEDIELMRTADGLDLPVDLQGMVRGSTEYWDLASRHQGPVAGHWSNGPFTGDFTAARAVQYPGEGNLFRQINYPVAGASAITVTSLPGSAYGPLNHVLKSGSALLTTPNIPSSVEYNADAGNVEAPYSYTWSKDPQGRYSAEIRDERGLVVKTGVADAAFPTSEADWILSTSEYDELGRPESSISPAGLSTALQYNGLGQVTQMDDPDRGMTEMLYDRRGRVRFTRSADGRAHDYMVATQYDAAGSVLGTARVSSASTYFTQEYADDSSFPGTANLHQGALYDAFEATLFQEATNVPLSSLGFTPHLRNTEGRLAVGYNRNLQAVPPGSWTNAGLLVATFYSYDSLGRLEEVWKYIGAAPTHHKWHKIKYVYDEGGRLTSTTVFRDQTEAQVASQSVYVYDAEGRITKVLDKSGQSLAHYTYDALNRLAKVRLPGDLSVSYAYDIQGKALSISGASGSKLLFQELLGYEAKPHSGIGDNVAVNPRFDGKISSIVRKFSSAAPNPVEWWRYSYDTPGRMVGALKHLPSSGGGLAPDGSITFPVSFNPTPTDERHYNYGDDGNIQSQSTASQTYVYGYIEGTHQLNSVTPDLPGRVTSAGSFVFDENGRLTADAGTGNALLYNFADRPVRMQLSGQALHYLYDENNNRVMTLDERGGGVVGKKFYVYQSGLKVAKEIVYRETSHPDGAIDVVKYHEYGKSGLVSVNFGGQNDRQVLLKDHQGSVIMAVASLNDGMAKETGYLPYGSLEQRVVAGTDHQVSQAFTGKEFEEVLGLYYFGARWLDPELGLWLAPDPAGQFFNPYSYGGDPINAVDPDGNFLRWRISGDGFSIGFNLTPIGIPLGAGVNVGWSGGGSIGGYGEVGYAVGGTGFGTGATVQAGADYGFRSGDVTGNVNALAFGGIGGWEANAGAGVGYNFNQGEVTSVSVSGGAGYGFVGVGGSYDFVSGGWNATVGLQSRTYGAAGIGYGSEGFNWYVAGTGETVSNLNESVQNRILFGSGMFMTNAEFNSLNPSSTSVAKAEALIARADAGSWAEETPLPEDARTNGYDWAGKPKCNRFCQVAAGAPSGTVQTLAEKAGQPGYGVKTSPKPGTVMLISPKPGQAHGHAVLLGRNGAFLHARTGAGAVSTTGWERVYYMKRNHDEKAITYVDY